VFLIHGGPQGFWGHAWSYRWNAQIFAAGKVTKKLKKIKYEINKKPITVSMSSLTADGSASAILCSAKFLNKKSHLKQRSVQIVTQHMVTDLPSTFGNSFMNLSGYEMSKKAANQCYRDANLTANDIDVIEVHDCFSPNELFMYEALGLAKEGEGVNLLREGKWIHTKDEGKLYKMKRWVVNPSGGLESKGHPIGATGIAQCYELVTQLRHEAGKRQVPNATIGLQQNFGIGGAAVVTIYRRNVLESKL